MSSGKKTTPESSFEDRIRMNLAVMDQDLPTIPVVLNQIMHLTSDDDSSINDLMKVLAQDQALTARILKVANSSYYSLPEKATTIRRAITILGMEQVRNLSVGSSFIHRFSPKNQHNDFDLNGFWAHATAVGVFAELIAHKFPPVPPGDAFTAGILHDIGKMVLLIYFEEEFGLIIKQVEEKRLDFFEAEKSTLNISHDGIAGILLSHWNIPETLVEAVTHHHQPNKAPASFQNLAGVIHLANFAAHYLQVGVSGSPYFSNPTTKLLKSMNLTVKDLRALLKNMEDNKGKVYNLISALD